MNNKNFEQILEVYVKRKLIAEIQSLLEKYLEQKQEENFFRESFFIAPLCIDYLALPEDIDFLKLFEENKGETFSEMLLRLIKESGEKNSAIYNRAQIDRQLFSRIKKNKYYRYGPSCFKCRC